METVIVRVIDNPSYPFGINFAIVKNKDEFQQLKERISGPEPYIRCQHLEKEGVWFAYIGKGLLGMGGMEQDGEDYLVEQTVYYLKHYGDFIFDKRAPDTIILSSPEEQ
jgi:hypothetical protein